MDALLLILTTVLLSLATPSTTSPQLEQSYAALSVGRAFAALYGKIQTSRSGSDIHTGSLTGAVMEGPDDSSRKVAQWLKGNRIYPVPQAGPIRPVIFYPGSDYDPYVMFRTNSGRIHKPARTESYAVASVRSPSGSSTSISRSSAEGSKTKSQAISFQEQ